MKSITSCCWALLLVALMSAVAKGGYIAGVTIEAASSELGAPIFDRSAGYLVSSAGLDVGTGTHSIIPDGTMWLTNGNFREPFDPLPAQVVFDLGGVYDLETVAVWNYNEFVVGADLVTRGARDVTISAGASLASMNSIGDFVFNQAPGLDNVDFRQDILVAGLPNTTGVRYVTFDITTNHGDTFDFAGLSKVRFTSAAIPEPTAGLLASLGAIVACGAWRRRSAPAAA